MPEITTIETTKILQLISALSDKTRLEIISLLIKFKDGLTAADISRKIDKKIPSTIHQLEIIQSSGLITNEMKFVRSIGREIKHWVLLQSNYSLSINIDLYPLIFESYLRIDIRTKYLDAVLALKKGNKIFEVSDLQQFNHDVLAFITFDDGTKLKEKEKTRILQLKARPLLIDTFIYKLRVLLRNVTLYEGYSMDFCIGMLCISKDVAALIIKELPNYQDIEYKYESEMIIRVK